MAWAGEKQRVTLTGVPSPDSTLQVFRPSTVNRNLDADVGGDLDQMMRFRQHLFVLGGGDFGADRAIDNGADVLKHVGEAATGLGHQRRVGGYAVDQAGGGQLADLIDVGGINKEFHRSQHPCIRCWAHVTGAKWQRRRHSSA